MNNAIKSETEANMQCFIYLVIGEVVCHETDVARQLKQGKSFAEHNKTVFEVAMAVAKFYKEQLDLRMDAYARERKALAENKELRERNEALKCQLNESNKQIEIHAKRERELESELEEYNDERNFI